MCLNIVVNCCWNTAHCTHTFAETFSRDCFSQSITVGGRDVKGFKGRDGVEDGAIRSGGHKKNVVRGKYRTRDGKGRGKTNINWEFFFWPFRDLSNHRALGKKSEGEEWGQLEKYFVVFLCLSLALVEVAASDMLLGAWLEVCGAYKMMMIRMFLRNPPPPPSLI